jgi:hypothetical protein
VQGVHLLFYDGMANGCVDLTNRAAMIDGGIPAILKTRRYVDTLSGWLQ